MKVKNDNQAKNFVGLLQKNMSDPSFIYLRLYEKDNKDGSTVKAPQDEQSWQNLFPHIGKLKEWDLLLLSSEKLDTKNVKKLTSADFLKDV